MLGFLNDNSFNIVRTEIQGESFFQVELSRRTMEKLFDGGIFFDRFGPHHFHFERFQLLLPESIEQYAEQGLNRVEVKPFKLEPSETESRYLYIDNDRVGLRVW